jgi:predicted lipoprotein with Yx(FWY)xxD motif
MRRLSSKQGMRRPPPLAWSLAVVAAALAAAGCGGAIPSSNGGPATLKLVQSADGRYLVDGHGRSLYVFEKDEQGESYCTGACAAVWPAYETESTPHAGVGIPGSALGTTKRDDGDMQVTYRGHPLYYYAADASTPGKTKGQGVEQFGAEWYLVGASGKPVEQEKPGSGGSGGHSNSGGGGY